MSDLKFKELYALDLSKMVEKKKTGYVELTYLSWANAWAEFVKAYPDAEYEIIKNDNNLPYFMDSTGAMVYTKVTVGTLTHEMWLPVMDGANKPMKLEAYSYKVKDKKTNQFVDRWVSPLNMFDVNKAVMRCLVKNLAMFGLGLYIYAGEDLPEPIEDAPAPLPTASKATDEDKKQAWHDFSEICNTYNVNPKEFLSKDVDMNDKKAVHNTVIKWLKSTDMLISQLENFADYEV